MKEKMGNFTAGMFKNYKHSVEELVNKDRGFRKIRMSNFLFNFILWDLKWKEIPDIISKLNQLKLSKECLKSMSYIEKCESLNSNPVLLTLHFQHRVETFFMKILLIPLSTIGKVTYYAIRIEFHVRGSSHVHSFLWILNSPKLSEETLERYIEFIDNQIPAKLPAP